MPEKYHLRLPYTSFDLSVLSATERRGAQDELHRAIAAYVRRQFAHLGGTLHTLSVDPQALEATWSPDSHQADPLAPVIKLLQQGKHPEAILLMRFLLSALPDDPTLLYNLSMTLSDKGELDDAIRLLSRLLELEPANVNGRVALGVALTRNTQTAEATVELRRAVEAGPDNPWAHRNLAACLMKSGEQEEAITHFRRATELNADDPLAWVGLGQALEMVGDDAGADQAYLKVLDLDEYSPVAEIARQGRRNIAQRNFRGKMPGNTERPDAVFYCLDALERFSKMSPEEVRQVGFEIAVLGTQGLRVNDPDSKYPLRTLPGEFSGLHLMCLMYVAFKQVAPEQDAGFDLAGEFALARKMFQAK